MLSALGTLGSPPSATPQPRVSTGCPQCAAPAAGVGADDGADLGRLVTCGGSEDCATCPVIQSGFVRVSSDRRIIPEAKSPAESILLLRRMTEVGSHFFWSDDTSLLDSEFISAQRIIGHRQVTDAHLVALTLRRQGRLATFDKGVAQVVPPTVKPKDVLIFLSA